MEIREDIEQLLDSIYSLSKDAKFILEIGIANGNGSTIAFSKVMKETTHKDFLYISVDLVDEMYGGTKPKSTKDKKWELILGNRCNA